MDFKSLVVTIALVSLSACAAQPQKVTKDQVFFENIALAICLGSASTDSAAQTDFNRSAAGYFEFSDLSLDALESIRILSDEWLAKPYVSKHGDTLLAMKCIDMLRSTDLHELYQQLTP